MSMTSRKPYLIRAIYEWLLDNQCTPYLLVNTSYHGVQVPQKYVKDGQIVLNIAPDAIYNLLIDNELISFSARFSGKSMDISIPITAVQMIYGKENNEGISFTQKETPSTSPDPNGQGQGKKASRPGLKVVK